MPISSRLALPIAAPLALLALILPAEAGWTQKAGHGLVITSLSYSTASALFDAQGVRLASERIEKIELQSYREFGITDRLTTIWAPTLTHLAIPGQGSVDQLSKLAGGLRIRLAEGAGWALAVQPGVEIPGPYDAKAPPSLGAGRVLWELRGLAGLSFSLFGRHGYLVAEVAPRTLGAGLAPSLATDATIGLDLSDELTLMVQSFNKWPLGGAAPSIPLYEEHKLAVSNLTPIGGRWSLQTGLGTTYAGRNGLAEVISFVGLWYRF